MLIAGLAVLAGAAVANALAVNSMVATYLLLLAGLGLTGWSLVALRVEIVALFRQRRGEQLVSTIGIIGVLIGVI